MGKARLLITDGFSPDGIAALEKSDLFSIDFNKSLDADEAAKKLKDADAVIIRSATRLEGALLEAGTNLKAIVRAGSGVDNIDVPHASKMGIYVFNTPGANNNAVVELTIGYLFSLLREIPRATAGMKANLWEKKSLVGGEVEGRSLGILGLGAIGGSVAQKCKALGMNVIGYDPKGRIPELSSAVDTFASSVDEVFEKSSMVSLHLPLLPETKNSIGKKQFSIMQDGAYLINCARGGIVNEADVVAALDSGKLAGAAFDVFASEPVAANDPLATHAKVICSPHIGAATDESQRKVGMMAVDRLIAFFKDNDTAPALNRDTVNKR